MLPSSSRRILETLSLVVAAVCVLMAVIERLFAFHLLGRVEVLLQLAGVAMLVAIWAMLDARRAD